MGKEYTREIVVLGEVPTLGPVAMFDNFEGVFKWAITGNLGDFAGTKETTVVYNENASMKLTTRVTNPAINDWVAAERLLFQRPGKRYAIEAIWRPESQQIVGWVIFRFDIHDGAYRHRGGIICDVEGGRWYYIREDDAAIELPNSPRQPAAGAWHRLRLEFDESTGDYIRLVADGQEVDMSALGYRHYSSISPVKFELHLEIDNVTANPAVVYYDDFLVMEI